MKYRIFKTIDCDYKSKEAITECKSMAESWREIQKYKKENQLIFNGLENFSNTAYTYNSACKIITDIFVHIPVTTDKMDGTKNDEFELNIEVIE